MKNLANVGCVFFLMATVGCVKEKSPLLVDQKFWVDLRVLEQEFLDLAKTGTRREFVDGATGSRKYFYGWRLDRLLSRRNELLANHGCYIYDGGWWVDNTGVFIDVDYDCPQDPSTMAHPRLANEWRR